MAEGNIQRRLAAIMAADVVGYSRLMDADEAGTYVALREALSGVIDPAISEHGGRIVKHMGDGFLAEFPTVLDAMECALGIQHGIGRLGEGTPAEQRLQFRIGINLGDIIVDETGDIFGDGVNVAARLESIASPGGICISGPVYETVRKKINVALEDLGEQVVKNISTKVRAYELRVDDGDGDSLSRSGRVKKNRAPAVIAAAVVGGLAVIGGAVWWQYMAPAVQPETVTGTTLSFPVKPSIAVLPFTNLSSEKEQEYFSDGVTEDIITDLTKVSGLFVVGRNSSFKFRGKSHDLRTVARDLGVRHVLEGSVRRAGEQLRITVQLVDATTGNHIWAERYNRVTKDIFAIQDEIAAKVAAELAVTLKADEQERLYRRYTDNLEAYDAYLRARRLSRPTRDANQRAKRKRIAERIIKLDPDFAAGYALLSYNLAQEVRLGQSASPEADIERALTFAQKAVATDDTFGPSYGALGNAYLMKHENDKAVAAGREAVRLLPSAADAYRVLGYFLHWAGRGDEAIDALKTAAHLDPKWSTGWLGYAYVTAGRYDDAISTLNQGYELKARRGTNSLSFLAAAYIATGQDEKARAVMNVFLGKHPKTTLSNYRSPRLYKRREDRERYLGLLRKAGMPE